MALIGHPLPYGVGVWSYIYIVCVTVNPAAEALANTAAEAAGEPGGPPPDKTECVPPCLGGG